MPGAVDGEEDRVGEVVPQRSRSDEASQVGRRRRVRPAAHGPRSQVGRLAALLGPEPLELRGEVRGERAGQDEREVVLVGERLLAEVAAPGPGGQTIDDNQLAVVEAGPAVAGAEE